MKCPKCGYLGFEQVDRCRNCGYEFGLASGDATPDLSLLARASDGRNAFEDLGFASEAPERSASLSAASDLPLFGQPADEPLITKPSPPRQPLAVRRATPDVPRLVEPRAQTLDLRPDETSWHGANADREPIGVSDAGLGSRLMAALIDLTILAVVDLAVIYFTAQICGISMQEIGSLPKGPLLAFFLVQNGGYLVVFTAGGQTLGKMAVGIRVVAAEESEPLDLGRALRRTLLWFVLAIPVGLGFLSALFAHDRRGLHDRFAGTRVVRASA